jgi:hypothetical protein
MRARGPVGVAQDRNTAGRIRSCPRRPHPGFRAHGNTGVGVREYTHWQWPNVYFMIIWWAVPYYILLWLHDNLSVEAKGRLAAASVVFAAGCHLLFAVLLGWV